MWNLENKQNGSKLISTENKQMVARWEGFGELGEKGEGIRKHTLAVRKS